MECSSAIKKECNTDRYYDMEEFWKYYSKWNKADTKE